MKVKARAKINLSLDVLGTRPDGYHQIMTVMQPLELHDFLEVSLLDSDIRIESDHPEVPLGPQNIVYQVGELMRERFACRRGVKIVIDKNIPVAAGLAGGSANAAAAIKALNGLWEIGANEEELYQVAERVGSDVPFCLLSRTALAQGRGEELTPLPSLAGFGVVLVKPPFGVSTAKVYDLYDQLPACSDFQTPGVIQAVQNKDIRALSARMSNGLERVTIGLYPQIQEIKDALMTAGAVGALMSGSGPTVFGLCEDPAHAAAVASRLKLPGCRIIVTKTI